MAATFARLLRTGVLRDIPELLGYERERGPDSNFWRRAWTGGKETSDRFEPRSQHSEFQLGLLLVQTCLLFFYPPAIQGEEVWLL